MLTTFALGEDSLDGWLRDHAAGAEARRVGRTFVWCAERENAVVAYCTLAGHLLIRDELPRSIGRGSPGEVPAVLVARLALDRRLQDQGPGGVLLADALARVVAATALVAACFVVVDALRECHRNRVGMSERDRHAHHDTQDQSRRRARAGVWRSEPGGRVQPGAGVRPGRRAAAARAARRRPG